MCKFVLVATFLTCLNYLLHIVLFENDYNLLIWRLIVQALYEMCGIFCLAFSFVVFHMEWHL